MCVRSIYKSNGGVLTISHLIRRLDGRNHICSDTCEYACMFVRGGVNNFTPDSTPRRTQSHMQRHMWVRLPTHVRTRLCWTMQKSAEIMLQPGTVIRLNRTRLIGDCPLVRRREKLAASERVLPKIGSDTFLGRFRRSQRIVFFLTPYSSKRCVEVPGSFCKMTKLSLTDCDASKGQRIPSDMVVGYHWFPFRFPRRMMHMCLSTRAVRPVWGVTSE